MSYLVWLFFGFSPSGLTSEDFDKRLEYQERFDKHQLNVIPAYLFRNHKDPEVAFRCNKILKTIPKWMEFTAKVDRFLTYNPFAFAAMKEYPKEWDKYDGPIAELTYREIQLFEAIAGILDLLDHDEHHYATRVLYGRVWARAIVQAQTGKSWKTQRDLVSSTYGKNKFIKP